MVIWFITYDLLNWKICEYGTLERLVKLFVIYNIKCDIYYYQLAAEWQGQIL